MLVIWILIVKYTKNKIQNSFDSLICPGLEWVKISQLGTKWWLCAQGLCALVWTILYKYFTVLYVILPNVSKNFKISQFCFQCDKRDRRPLHCAAFRGHEAVARLLLQNGAEVEVRDKVHTTYTQLSSKMFGFFNAGQNVWNLDWTKHLKTEPFENQTRCSEVSSYIGT